MELCRLPFRMAAQIVFAAPAALCQDEQHGEEQHRDHGGENRVEVKIVDLLLDDQPRDADARHPAASAQLNGVVDALLVDVEIVRDRMNGDALSGGCDLPECRQSRRVARRTAQFEAVGMVDDHPFGIEQRGVSAAGRTLRHAGIDFGQRKINAAYMPAARAVRHRAGHAPDLNPSRTGHMAAHRVAVRCGDEPLPEISGCLRGAGCFSARVAADRAAPGFSEPDAPGFGVHPHQRRREHVQFGVRRRGALAHELHRGVQHPLRTLELDL